MSRYLKLAAICIIWAIIGAAVAAIAGYLCGAAGGLALTFYNNNFLPDAPQGSYLWWANFVGYIMAVLMVLPGAVVGLIVSLIKSLINSRSAPARS